MRWYLVRIRVKDGRGETEVLQCSAGKGVRRGSQGTSPDTGRDGSEGGEEAVHMPTGVTYVTEKPHFLVKGAVTHLTLCIIREGTGRGGDKKVCGPGRG